MNGLIVEELNNKFNTVDHPHAIHHRSKQYNIIGSKIKSLEIFCIYCWILT